MTLSTRNKSLDKENGGASARLIFCFVTLRSVALARNVVQALPPCTCGPAWNESWDGVGELEIALYPSTTAMHGKGTCVYLCVARFTGWEK